MYINDELLVFNNLGDRVSKYYKKSAFFYCKDYVVGEYNGKTLLGLIKPINNELPFKEAMKQINEAITFVSKDGKYLDATLENKGFRFIYLFNPYMLTDLILIYERTKSNISLQLAFSEARGNIMDKGIIKIFFDFFEKNKDKNYLSFYSYIVELVQEEFKKILKESLKDKSNG
jgi:hypothetical protein